MPTGIREMPTAIESEDEMTDNGEGYVTQNLSLYPQDRAVLHQVAKDLGLNSISAAARYIIRDWLKQQTVRAHHDAPSSVQS